MIGYLVTDKGTDEQQTTYDAERVYDCIVEIIGDDDEAVKIAIDASSWSEIASIGEVYEAESFTVEVIEDQ